MVRCSTTARTTVFAPTNEAFAKMDPAELEALKAEPGRADQRVDTTTWRWACWVPMTFTAS